MEKDKITLYKYIESIAPSEIAKFTEVDSRLSTRKKANILKKVLEIEKILEKSGVDVLIKKKC